MQFLSRRLDARQQRRAVYARRLQAREVGLLRREAVGRADHVAGQAFQHLQRFRCAVLSAASLAAASATAQGPVSSESDCMTRSRSDQ